jgi:hypothetical protein
VCATCIRLGRQPQPLPCCADDGCTYALQVHRMIFQARSPWFKRMIQSGMREFSEGTATIKEMHAPVFRALLHFVYSDTLPEELEGTPRWLASVQLLGDTVAHHALNGLSVPGGGLKQHVPGSSMWVAEQLLVRKGLGPVGVCGTPYWCSVVLALLLHSRGIKRSLARVAARPCSGARR